jgi:hypothetical protein
MASSSGTRRQAGAVERLSTEPDDDAYLLFHQLHDTTYQVSGDTLVIVSNEAGHLMVELTGQEGSVVKLVEKEVGVIIRLS